MIRYTYINHMVLKTYERMKRIVFPLDPRMIVENIPNCKYLSYQEFAAKYGCTIQDVIDMCESNSGCTHFDASSNRFLILCNQSMENNNNLGRQRWTCSHEIGHVLCGHHIAATYDKLAEHNMMHIENKIFESEADYYAATLLSPFPLYKVLGIRSVIDVQNVFGLSCEASLYRYKQYLKWRTDHQKSAWENDMVKVYLQKRAG